MFSEVGLVIYLFYLVSDNGCIYISPKRDKVPLILSKLITSLSTCILLLSPPPHCPQQTFFTLLLINISAMLNYLRWTLAPLCSPVFDRTHTLEFTQYIVTGRFKTFRNNY